MFWVVVASAETRARLVLASSSSLQHGSVLFSVLLSAYRIVRSVGLQNTMFSALKKETSNNGLVLFNTLLYP
jgi:hypothetical protein